MQVMIKMAIVTIVLFTVIPKSASIAAAIRGVHSYRKCCCCSRQEGKYCKQIDDSPCPSVCMFSKNRSARFRKLLAISFPYVKHKAESYGKN